MQHTKIENFLFQIVEKIAGYFFDLTLYNSSFYLKYHKKFLKIYLILHF